MDEADIIDLAHGTNFRSMEQDGVRLNLPPDPMMGYCAAPQTHPTIYGMRCTWPLAGFQLRALPKRSCFSYAAASTQE